MKIIDIHTHDSQRGNHAIINIAPTGEILPNNNYSMGIHPWDVAETTENDLCLLKERSAHHQVVAIGETGLDVLKGGDLDKQINLFKYHIEVSELYQKPLIIHAVKTFQQIILIHRTSQPTVPWIIHGFRGNAELAQQLLKHGFYLSFGERFNPAAVMVVPTTRLLIETDESRIPIEKIAEKIIKYNPKFDLNRLPLFNDRLK